MSETSTIAANEDPVCGMSVDVEEARAQSLTLVHEGHEYAFCGKGCLLDFRDEPERFLAPTISHACRPASAIAASKPLAPWMGRVLHHSATNAVISGSSSSLM